MEVLCFSLPYPGKDVAHPEKIGSAAPDVSGSQLATEGATSIEDVKVAIHSM